MRGLSISKSIVEDFGGVMQIESTVGKGTKTIISLPALDRRAGQEEG